MQDTALAVVFDLLGGIDTYTSSKLFAAAVIGGGRHRDRV